jgi:hypothetical protein
VRFAPVPPVSAQGQAAPEPPAKDACTQSDFRESEVQTLPWTPGYVLPQEGTRRAAKQSVVSGVRHCEGPELLQLTDLKWGDGLPGAHGPFANVDARQRTTLLLHVQWFLKVPGASGQPVSSSRQCSCIYSLVPWLAKASSTRTQPRRPAGGPAA